METQFTPEQVVIISLVASVIVFVINEIADINGIQIGRARLTAGLYAIAFILAVLFTPQVFPAMPDMAGDPAVVSAGVLNYLGALVTQLALLVGVATTIYNLLGKQVLDLVATRLLRG